MMVQQDLAAICSCTEDFADAVGSVALHPVEPRLATVSGSRHFEDIKEDLVQVDEDGDSELEDDVQKYTRRVNPFAFDAAMKIWDL